MTELDDTLVPEVATLISTLGVAATWVSRDEVSSHSGTPDIIDTPYSVTVSPLLNYDRRQAPGDVIEEGSLHVYIAGQNLEFTPRVGDELRITNHPVRRVVWVKPLYSGVQVAAYDVGLRE